MQAARLHSARDIRLDEVESPATPVSGEVLLRIDAVGICGSDLHSYADGHIGDTLFDRPITLGHEFMGTIIATGDHALDGNFQPLAIGTRVAVDPACPCYHCEMCEKGHPNLCPNHTFIGLFPEEGALQEKLIVKARNCFPMPDSISDGAGTLLETLGVAIHALDLGKIKVGHDVAVIGSGPVGLLIIQLLRLAGVNKLFAFDLNRWRAEKACELGATHAWIPEDGDFAELVEQHTSGRGVDVSFEVAWSDHSVQLAAEMVRHGGRLVLVGIPGDDNIILKHSTARRKGLTIMMCRRMKHTYPRAITLATTNKVQLDTLISHHFSLTETPQAFETNLNYEDNILKVIIDVSGK